MKTTLYRLAVLALLIRIDSTLSEIIKQLHVLRVLAQHPARQVVYVPPNMPAEQLLRLRKLLQGSSPGGAVVLPFPSFDASQAETAPGPGTTASIAATGRSARTSGETGAGSDLLAALNSLPDVSRTRSRTSASEQEAGSRGSAPASSGSTPSHNHPAILSCAMSCPAYFAVQKDKIEASGRAAICVPSLQYPISNCDEHPHVAGEHRP